MTVKKQKKIIFGNNCGCIVDEKILEKAMLWIADAPQCGKKTIFLHGRYPGVSIHGKKYHVHRLIKMYKEKCLIASNIAVHHIDGNRLNAMPQNLEFLDFHEHASHHNKGKTLSEDHKAKIAEAGRKRKGIKLEKRVNVDLNKLREMLFSGKSINSCAKYFKCDWSTIKQRIHENPELLEVAR